MNLRPATIRDLELLKYWDKQQHVIDNVGVDVWDWENDLLRQVDWCELYIAEHQGKSIGFIQILDPYRDEEAYWGEVSDNLRAIDIWIGEKQDLGKGYGSVMMKIAVNKCFSNNDVQGILLDPFETNRKAHRFYERLGFRFIEKRLFDQDKCLVYRLDRNIWEQLASLYH